MKYYELKNKKTGTQYQATGKNLQTVYKAIGLNPRDCHIIYSYKIN